MKIRKFIKINKLFGNDEFNILLEDLKEVCDIIIM